MADMADRLTLGNVVRLLAPRNARRDSGGTTRIGVVPCVLSGLVAILGSAAASGRVSGFLGFLLGCAALGHKIRVEEHWLMREFGDQYREYRRSNLELSALCPV
jgi:hypothetical protein